jgi:hypothetical protein
MCGPSAAKQGAKRGGHERPGLTENTPVTETWDMRSAEPIRQHHKLRQDVARDVELARWLSPVYGTGHICGTDCQVQRCVRDASPPVGVISSQMRPGIP